MTMMIALAGALCLLLAWILVVPVSMVLDTSHGRYCLSQPGTFSVSFIPGIHPGFRFKVFGFELERSKSRKKREPEKPRKKDHAFRTSSSELRKLVRAVLDSITVRRLFCNVDTDTMFWNAVLVPVGLCLNDNKTKILSNYHGEVTLLIDVRVALYKLALPFARVIIKHK